ncbi:DUF3048 domain-containing protein [Halobacillus salinarum]|uniref:DUF3048 domain-containing protein n=1 Tax=Halobacillus salinarum TaxID=2932257 RepID=A0ABY4EKC6_9BACI|nr:DUF3048 domain-containing protein [Halobacillus salinarum]UOQ44084.1 DUF3048 domain-containing protein [Halobacillus salinarum]
MKKHIGLAVLLLSLLLMAACSKGEEKESTDAPEGKVTAQEKENPVDEETAFSQFTYPLTGKPAEEKPSQRVIAVMVNNHTKARPQTGLSQADVVYEVLAEGEITRFVALFQSHIPDKIGPVRSARPYFMKLAQGYDSVYIYHGASVKINQFVANSGIDFLNGSMYDNNGWLFMRSNDRMPPHNSYLLTSGIDKAIRAKGYNQAKEMEALPFGSEDELKQGQSVQDVTITYSNQPQEVVSFTYDSEQKQFLRSSDGEPTVEKESNDRIAVDNIFVVKTSHQVIDSKGRREVDLTSGGKGYLFYKGQMMEVNWKNDQGRILPYLDGQPLKFAKGKTWVNIVPNDTNVAAQ